LVTTPAQAATLLFPNLKTLAPRDLRFDRTDVDPEPSTTMHNVLRFTNTVWNAGAGRLELRGTINPATKTGTAVQRVYDNEGGFSDLLTGNNFYWHAVHQHYHFDNWGRYELWTKAGYDNWIASGRKEGNPVLGAKTTSCVEDEEFIETLPNQPYPAPYSAEGCFPNSQNLMLQGLSPGWGDTYDYYRFEQWIDLGASGSLADGQYVLRSVVDPSNKIYESPGKADPATEGEPDNEAITPFAVVGGQLVDSNPPSGSVRINDIDPSTSSSKVTVKVLGRDDISGVANLRLSNDGTTWTQPRGYTGIESTAQSIPWDLTDASYGGDNLDGTKTVYVEFQDASGKWSSVCASDSIVLDRGGVVGATKPPPACLGLPVPVPPIVPTGAPPGQSSPTPIAPGAAPPTCNGVPATIVGTTGNDSVVGTNRRDVIVTLGGNDKIRSLGGPDIVCAGGGNDRVSAGTGTDDVSGGPGRDRLRGGGGPDVLNGEAGNDILEGDQGPDQLIGGSGRDTDRDGAEEDSVSGCERRAGGPESRGRQGA
jgi:Ca2+-binding RTX toxin-like protein